MQFTFPYPPRFRAASRLIVLAWAVVAACAGAARGIELRNWQSTPYRVRLHLAVDDSRRPQPQLGEAIARHINDRVEATLQPVWSFELAPATDPATRRQCSRPVEIPWEEFPEALKPFDKVFWMSVEATPAGYVVRCREFDAFLRRWGAVKERLVSQSAFLREACFQLLTEAFSPLAIITSLPENEDQVQLVLKGSRLHRANVETPIAAGEPFEPVLRRTDRSGSLVENGVQPIPWTLLTAASRNDQGWIADVHTGIRRPFGMRRTSLIEQVAIALRNAPGPTRLRFHARSDAKQGLAGYEVFRATADGGSDLVGLTDRDGVISVPPGPGAVSTLMLRSDGQLLSKLPIVAGAPGLIQTPVPDDATRLQAQAEARVVREELIDVVARRAILMARTRALLKAGRVDDAKKAMQELDELPSSATFNRSLDAIAKRLPDSADPQVEKTIEKLFTTTRDLLGKFLSTRPVLDLQSEVNAAAKSGE